MRSQSILLGMCGLLGLALAMPAQAWNDELKQEISVLQQQTTDLNQQLTALEAQDKSQDQAHSVMMLNLQAEIDTLKSDLAQAHGVMDEQAHELAMDEKRQTDLYQDLDTRLRALSNNNSATVPSSGSTGGAGAPTGSDGGVDSSVDSNPVAQAYQSALTQFKQGAYKASIVSFTQFIQANPQDAMASSAQYWIGNAYFSLKDFKNAALAQKKLLKIYPKSSKAPDAMLNLSSAQVEQGDLVGAIKILKLLIKKYPDTAAAALAQKRLLLLQSA